MRHALSRPWPVLPHVAEIVAALEHQGQLVDPEHLARISPLANAHVIPSGTYHFEQASTRQQVPRAVHVTTD